MFINILCSLGGVFSVVIGVLGKKGRFSTKYAGVGKRVEMMMGG